MPEAEVTRYCVGQVLLLHLMGRNKNKIHGQLRFMIWPRQNLFLRDKARNRDRVRLGSS